MAIILIVLFQILTFVLWITFFQKDSISVAFRKAIISTFLSFSLISFLFTEVFSLFNLLNKEFFIIGYLVFDLILFIIAIKFRNIIKEMLLNIRFSSPFILFLILIVIPLLFLALYFPPHIWDSLTYHLPRIEHWIQNQSINHFPVNDERQLFSQPFSEYLILQHRIISGSDIFNSSIQLYGFFVLLISMSLMIKLFNGDSKTQWFGILLVGSVPIFLSQATTTQNDLLMSTYFVVFIYFAFVFLRSNNILYLVLATFALSIGMLTKASIYVFALPFILFFVLKYLKAHNKYFGKPITVIVFIFLLVNSPYFLRNVNQTGSLFGSKQMESKMTVERITIKNTLANIVRTNGMLLGLPSEKYNMFIDHTIESFFKMIDTDINDPSITMPSHKYKTTFNPNVFHYVIIVFGLFTLVFLTKVFRKNQSDVLWISFLAILGFILHSALFRWSVISSTRYYMPIFSLLLMIPAYIFSYNMRNNQLAIRFSINSIILLISFLILTNGYKPILDIRSYIKSKTMYLPKTIKNSASIEKLDSIDRQIFLQSFQLDERYSYPFYVRKDGLSSQNKEYVYNILSKHNLLVNKSSILNNTRLENRFYNFPEFKDDYLKISSIVNDIGALKIGMMLTNEDFEYLFWHLFLTRNKDIKIRNILFAKYKESITNDEFLPDVIVTNYKLFNDNELEGYIRLDFYRDLKLFVRKELFVLI